MKLDQIIQYLCKRSSKNRSRWKRRNNQRKEENVLNLNT